MGEHAHKQEANPQRGELSGGQIKDTNAHRFTEPEIKTVARATMLAREPSPHPCPRIVGQAVPR